MSAATQIIEGVGKRVFFQSRFKNYSKVLEQKRLGMNEGKPIYDNLKVQFQNFTLIVDDTPENAHLLELLRKKAGTDYQEVDLAKKAKAEAAREAELETLRNRIKELEALVASPSVKVRRAKAAVPA